MTRVVLLDQKYVHIDGYKSILSLDEEIICIQCKKKILEISGKKLMIDTFNGIEMTISGFISGIRWLSL